MSTPFSGPHQTDAIGARDVAAEATQIAHTAREFSSRAPQQSGETPGVEQAMLKSVEYIALLPIPRYDISTYIPSAHMLFTVIQEMDTPLLTHRQFSSELLRWTPLHSRLYYGTLFYIQTLRAMDSVGALNSSNRVFLRNFEDHYPPSSLPIAGPLVCFYKALTACDSPYPELGAITPALPATTQMVANEHGALPLPARVLLPNLSGIKHGILTTRLPLVAGAHIPWDRNLANSAANAAAVAVAHNAADNQPARDARVTPGTVHPVLMSARNLREYAQAVGHVRIPPPAATVANMTWATYLGFATDFSWFGQLVGQMQKHAHFYRGSTTLSACSPRDGPTSLVVCTQQAAYPDRDAHRAAAIETIVLSAIATSQTDRVNPPCDKLGMMTQLNWVPAANFTPDNDHAGAINHTRNGPFWTLAINRASSQVYDPTTLIPQIIASDFILDRSINAVHPR